MPHLPALLFMRAHFIEHQAARSRSCATLLDDSLLVVDPICEDELGLELAQLHKGCCTHSRHCNRGDWPCCQQEAAPAQEGHQSQERPHPNTCQSLPCHLDLLQSLHT